MGLLNALIKASGNDLADIVENGVLGDVLEWYDSGSYLLNAQFSGSMFKGIPNNKTICFAGAESVGKTYLLTSIQKSFLNQFPDGECCSWDSENALTKEHFTKRELDVKRIAIYPIDTVINFRNEAIAVCNKVNEIVAGGKRPHLLFTLDSLGNLASDKEMEDAEKGEKKVDMTRAKNIRSIFRVLNLKLAKHGIPLIISNHTYENPMSFSHMQVVAGGGGVKYSASLISMITKAKDKDSAGNVLGGILTSTMIKSRISKEWTKVKLQLDYMKGLNRWYGLPEKCIDAGIWKKIGHSIVDSRGEKFKEKECYNHPEKYFTDDLMKELDKYLATLYCFGDDLPDIPEQEYVESKEKIEEPKEEIKESKLLKVKEPVESKNMEKLRKKRGRPAKNTKGDKK